MPGPRWDPDEGRWVLGDEPSPAPRRGRRRTAEVIDRTDGDVGSPARHLSPEDLAAGIVFPPHREHAARPVVARDRRPDPADDALLPWSAVTDRHGADRSAAGRLDHGQRRGHRRAPETSEPDVPPPDLNPGGRRSADTAPPGHDRTGRARHGGRRRAGDGDDPARLTSDGHARGRHGVDDRYPLDGGDRPATRRGRAVEFELDRRDALVRPDGRPHPDDPWRDRGYPDHEWPGHPSAGSGPDDLGYVTDDSEYGPDDEATQVIVHGSGPVHDGEPGSGLPDDPAGERPARELGRRRGRTGRDDVRPARRRRWPWVVGAAAAIAAAVPIGLVVFDGSHDGVEASRTEATVAFGTPTGSSEPGSAPVADDPVVDAAAPPAAAQVTYEVTGSGSAGTITVGRGTSVSQVSGAELPWQQTSPADVEPTEYSVSAAGGSGEISCRIVVDGAVLSEQSAEGDYSAVSCSGRR